MKFSGFIFSLLDLRGLVFLLSLMIHGMSVAAGTDSHDYVALTSLMKEWNNIPSGWTGSDPCGSGWQGISCSSSRIISIILPSAGLAGHLAGDIGSLSALQILDLSYNPELKGTLPASIGNLSKLTNLILVACGFSGAIPATIGSLQELVFLSLNSNQFSGPIPASIGNLSKLNWLDLADNLLDGPIPVSSGTTPGLDMLLHAKHFHLGRNRLSGAIPQQIFNSSMNLIHLLLDNNSLTGSIPDTLGLLKTLEVVRLDGNKLYGNVPSSLNNLRNVSQLFLSNNMLTGPIPNLTDMVLLSYVDISNNSFDASLFPSWFSTLQSLTTLKMEHTQLQGAVPVDLFSLPNLQTLVLSNNQLNGTLDIGSTYSHGLKIIDMRGNQITEVKLGAYSSELILFDNPVCLETGTTATYCTVPASNSTNSWSTPNNCFSVSCSSTMSLSPNCKCAYPYTGTLIFRARKFSDLGNSSRFVELQTSLMKSFNANNLPADSVSLAYPRTDSSDYLRVSLTVFPFDEDHFNLTGISGIGFVLSNQTFKPSAIFGPYFFLADPYPYLSGTLAESNHSASIGIIIGAAIGGSVLLLLLVLAGLYAFHQKRRAEKATERQNPFAKWDSNKGSGGVPQLKGARLFSFQEVKKCTNNFSEENDIGSGGYGKVYRGTLPTGELIAIKRAQKESMQGGLEFKSEIELLSRVHHKNLVSLHGFCFEEGEQMLVYEYVPSGNLRDCLSGKTGIRLDWMRRLRIGLGAARGLAYLHELANPPIIHRDIKSNNILLDERLNAKVADFGLSKPMTDGERDHVTTQVKGTMGYMDPEYYMTQQLTEKSDVYSFGVLMLELITGRKPLERGKYIVREVRMTMDKNKNLYNLQGVMDPAIDLEKVQGLEKFVDLAMSCVEESAADRPTMGEVVKEIESIMLLAGLNPNPESGGTSASYEEASGKAVNHPYVDSDFSYSGSLPHSMVEPL